MGSSSGSGSTSSSSTGGPPTSSTSSGSYDQCPTDLGSSLGEAGSSCAPAGCPTLLAKGQYGIFPIVLAVGATDVYWTNEQNVMTAPLAGGKPASLAAWQDRPSTIAVDATHVYWSDYCGAIMKAPLGGGAVTTIVSSSLGSLFGIALDATSVYWTAWNPTETWTLMKAPLEGGTPTTLATGLNGGDIAVDATGVYVADPGPGSQPGGGAVLKVPLAGGSPVPIASGVTVPRSIALDATNVYWISADGVMKAPKSGGAVRTLVSAPTDLLVDLAVDGSNVYFTSGGTTAACYADGSVMKVPVGGGTPVTIAIGQIAAGAIAVDGTSVYWATNGYRVWGSENGTIAKLPLQ